MKKSGFYLGLLAMMSLIACKGTDEVKTESVETQTIETVHDQPTDTVVVKTVEEAPEGTSVKINGDGISVNSKNGEKNVDVNVDVKK